MEVIGIVTLVVVLIILIFIIAALIVFALEKKKFLGYVGNMVESDKRPKENPKVSYGGTTAGSNATQSVVWQI